jgi:hypothetical protein
MREQYLTEAMGECWHDLVFQDTKETGFRGDYHICKYCGKELYYDPGHPDFSTWQGFGTDFSTWQGFGKLWEWAIKQKWMIPFLMNRWGFRNPWQIYINTNLVNPNNFADALYEFLKGRNESDT